MVTFPLKDSVRLIRLDLFLLTILLIVIKYFVYELNLECVPGDTGCEKLREGYTIEFLTSVGSSTGKISTLFTPCLDGFQLS